MKCKEKAPPAGAFCFSFVHIFKASGPLFLCTGIEALLEYFHKVFDRSCSPFGLGDLDILAGRFGLDEFFQFRDICILK